MTTSANESSDVSRMRDAANVLIRFFDDAIAVTEKYKRLEQEHNAAKTAYYEIMDRVDREVGLYSRVFHRIECKMGPMEFMNDEQMKEIRKMVREKELQFRCNLFDKRILPQRPLSRNTHRMNYPG